MNQVIARKGRRELDTIMHDAAALGTKIHALSEQIAWRRGAFVPPGMEPYAEALREFFDTHVRTVVFTERPLASERERVGGTPDVYAEMQDGSMAVVDLKCKRSAGITDVNRAQVAGYALLLREHGFEVNKRVILRLHTSEEKKGRWYARSCQDHAGDVAAFRAAVEIYWWRHGKRMRKAA